MTSHQRGSETADTHRLRTTHLASATWSLPALLLLGVGIAAAADGPQPSFPCARAATPAERAICKHPALATGDVAVARSYRAALARLDAAAAKALKDDQRNFLALRDSLMDDDEAAIAGAGPRRDPIAELASLQRERSAFLDSVVVPPRGEVAGTWKTMSGSVDIGRDGKGALAVHLNAVEPDAGRWVCEFTGHGRVGPDGVVVVTPDDGEGASLSLRRDGAALAVRALPVGDAEYPEVTYCGLNGSVDGSYFRTRQSRKTRTTPH